MLPVCVNTLHDNQAQNFVTQRNISQCSEWLCIVFVQNKRSNLGFFWFRGRNVHVFMRFFSDPFLNLTLNTHPDLIPAERGRLCRLLFGIEIGCE